MIVFDVTCSNAHTFEGWFKDSETFEAQVANGEVVCPVCGDTKVAKGLMAPRLGGMRKAKDAPEPNAAMSPANEKLDEYVTALHELKKYVEDNSDYVGDKFPDEARKIHYGETEARSIHGEATPDEARELDDEGVDFHRIPWPGKSDA